MTSEENSKKEIGRTVPLGKKVVQQLISVLWSTKITKQTMKK